MSDNLKTFILAGMNFGLGFASAWFIFKWRPRK